MMSDDPIKATRRLAETHGLEFRDCGGGHVQIHGNGVLVNYWPLSRRQTAFSPETGARITHCTPYNAVKLAMKGRSGAEIRPKAHRKPRKHGPDTRDIEPTVTNPANLRHLYAGDEAPWALPGTFLFAADSDRLRYQAWRKAGEAVALHAKADQLDERDEQR